MQAVLVTYGLRDMSEGEYQALCDHAAPEVAAIDGLVSKLWLTDYAGNSFGGLYLFESPASVDAFLAHPLMQAFESMPQITALRVRRYDVAEGPSRVTRALPAAAVH